MRINRDIIFSKQRNEFNSKKKELMISLSKTDYETKTIVLRKTIDDESAKEIIDEKKADVFRVLLKKPSKDEVHLHSIKLYYEAILMISGKYTQIFIEKQYIQSKYPIT